MFVCLCLSVCVVTPLECEVIGELCVCMWRLWNAVVSLTVCVRVRVREKGGAGPGSPEQYNR